MIVKTCHEGELIPNGVSMIETSKATYIAIQHYPNRMTIRIPKDDPTNYTITEETLGDQT